MAVTLTDADLSMAEGLAKIAVDNKWAMFPVDPAFLLAAIRELRERRGVSK